ncbi:MAG: hypothetical protein PVG20_10135 [Thioalkalispiraceae bacterium]
MKRLLLILCMMRHNLILSPALTYLPLSVSGSSPVMPVWLLLTPVLAVSLAGQL